jgi:hypothetical protein
LRWQLEESMLEDASALEELAVAAADQVERTALRPGLGSPGRSDVPVIFEDEAQFRASHLLAIARSETAWYHETLHDIAWQTPLAYLATPENRALAEATLIMLAREGVLAEAVAVQPAPDIESLAKVLGYSAPIFASDSVGPTPVPPATKRSNLAELIGMASRWPVLSPAAQSLAFLVHAAVLLDTSLQAPEASALANAVLVETLSLHSVGDDRAVAADRVPTMPSAVDDRRSPEGFAVAEEEIVEVAPSIATRCAGLFYLLDRFQELDIPESIWKACLPEGMVLTAAASALLGPRFATDPASKLFGGTDKRPRCPKVTPEQQAEIAVTACAALAEALPRRGLAEIPSVIVSLADHSSGKLLVGAIEGSPFAFFAWPATTPGNLTAGLDALLKAWPYHDKMIAVPALVGLDSSGRLQYRMVSKVQPLFIPEASSSVAAALLTIVVGAPCALFAARAGASPLGSAADFVTRFLAKRGYVRLRARHMDVVLKAEDVDFDVRRAGLDRDPGWLPWLQRTVRFIYEGSEVIDAPTAELQ